MAATPSTLSVPAIPGPVPTGVVTQLNRSIVIKALERMLLLVKGTHAVDLSLRDIENLVADLCADLDVLPDLDEPDLAESSPDELDDPELDDPVPVRRR